MEKLKILIVDDDERIRDMITEYISEEGYAVYEASDGVEALNIIKKHDFSIIILDIMMPKIDGWRVCKEIRKFSDVPIIMLSARGEEYDKLFGFELGADDYIVKPFSPKELSARIRAILGRRLKSHKTDKSKKFIYRDMIIEFDSRSLLIDNQIINLTPKEYELLSFFAKNPNMVFSREKLLDEVWGYDFSGDYRTVDTHIKMLRESMKEYRSLIVTVWGTGYKFEVRETV